jgi:ComF family protein
LRPFDRIITLGHYAEPLREWIHRVKYHGNWPLAEALAAKLWQSESVRELLAQSDCLVPVPLHWSRQIERGFDQSRVLAEWLSRHSGLPVIRPVMRRRRTASQALLPARWRRRDNVRDAFALVERRRPMTTGQRVVLVDDMVTTGSTVRAVAWAIKGLRPARLSVLAVARSDPLGRQFEQI